MRDHKAGRRRKSTEGTLDESDGHITSEHEDEENEVPDDPKLQKEIEHLKSMSGKSGAAKVRYMVYTTYISGTYLIHEYLYR